MREYGTLYIPPEPKRKTHEANGKFAKGHLTHTTGKKWSDWLTEEQQERIKKQALKNLEKGRGIKRPDVAEKNKKKCIAVFPDGTWKMFTSMEQGALFFGVNNNSISTVCRRNRQRLHNNSNYKLHKIRWYFEDDEQWISKIKQQ